MSIGEFVASRLPYFAIRERVPRWMVGPKHHLDLVTTKPLDVPFAELIPIEWDFFRRFQIKTIERAFEGLL